MDLYYKSIGEQVRHYRRLAKMSQLDLAEMTDSSPQYISEIECGKKRPSLDILIRISNVLQVSIGAFLIGHTPIQTEELSGGIRQLLTGCTEYELKVMLEVANATKEILIENRWMIKKP